jgi:hypothetical protein
MAVHRRLQDDKTLVVLPYGIMGCRCIIGGDAAIGWLQIHQGWAPLARLVLPTMLCTRGRMVGGGSLDDRKGCIGETHPQGKGAGWNAAPLVGSWAECSSTSRKLGGMQLHQSEAGRNAAPLVKQRPSVDCVLTVVLTVR